MGLASRSKYLRRSHAHGAGESMRWGSAITAVPMTRGRRSTGSTASRHWFIFSSSEYGPDEVLLKTVKVSAEISVFFSLVGDVTTVRGQTVLLVDRPAA